MKKIRFSFWMAVLFLFSGNTVSFAEDGKYIVNLLSGRCINVSGDPGTASGTSLTLADCQFSGKTGTNNLTDQKWVFTSDGFIKNTLSGRCINVSGDPGTANGTQLTLADCQLSGKTETNNPTDQKWILTNDGFIKNILSGRCIDVSGSPGTNSGTQLVLYDCEFSGQASNNTPTDQKWELLPQVSKGDIDGDNDVILKDTISVLQICAGIKPISAIYRNADVNGDGKIGLAEAIYTLQIIAKIRFDKDLIITEITDTKTNLGAVVTDSSYKEALAIFGEKTAGGVLNSVTNVTLFSMIDNNQWMDMELTADKLPGVLSFSDGKKAIISNYTDTSADITVYDSAGNKIFGPVSEQISMDNLKQAQVLLKQNIQYERICPQAESDAAKLQMLNWVKAAFILYDGVGCVLPIIARIMAPAVAPAISLPGSILACTSFASELIVYAMEMIGKKPPILLKNISDFSGNASMADSCAQALLLNKKEKRLECGMAVGSKITDFFIEHTTESIVRECSEQYKPSINFTCNGGKSCTIACKGTASLEISYSGIKGGTLEIDGPGIWGHFTYYLPADSESDILKLNVIHANAVAFDGCYAESAEIWVSITGSWGSLYADDVTISLERCPGGYSDILPCYYKIKQ